MSAYVAHFFWNVLISSVNFAQGENRKNDVLDDRNAVLSLISVRQHALRHVRFSAVMVVDVVKDAVSSV